MNAEPPPAPSGVLPARSGAVAPDAVPPLGYVAIAEGPTDWSTIRARTPTCTAATRPARASSAGSRRTAAGVKKVSIAPPIRTAFWRFDHPRHRSAW